MNKLAIRSVTLVYLCLILFIVYSAISGSNTELLAQAAQIPGADKTCHIILIGGLCFLLNLSFDSRSLNWGALCISKLSVFLLALVSIEEFSQNFLINRTADWNDWLGNLAGIILGDLLARLIKSRL